MKKLFLFVLSLTFCSMVYAGNPLLEAYKTPHQTIPFSKIKTEHFEPAFEKAMKDHSNEIDAIVNNKEKPTFQNTIEAMEFSGDLLERISSVFFNLLSSESNDEMMAISQRIQPKLTEHGNNINLNEKLFERIKTIYSQKDNLNLNGEQMRLLTNTYDAFVNRGANLSPENKQKYRELSSKLSSLTLQFGQNVLKETNKYEMLLVDEKQLEGLPESVREAAAHKAQSKGKKGWLIDLTAPSFVPFMKYSSNRDLRKELYIASTTKCKSGEFSNMENIKEIVNTRFEIAKLIGYSSYADQVLVKRMAHNTKNVDDLLQKLLIAYKPVALQEYKEVQGFAIGMEKKNIDIMPYDWSYYSERLKDSKFDLNDEMVRPYFELENVKKGVFGLATELYGITFKKNPKIQVYNPEVDAYEVYDQNGEYLAVLYTDFHPRAGKRSGAWMSEFQGESIKKGKSIRPHITLVMNFTRPTSNNPALLTFDEVETFLHEFGHSLHGMFASTVYPSMSGTNVYRDFVELPSQFMENFLTEKLYLDQFAVHYKTGEKIPEGLVKKLIDASNFNTGYVCLRQLSLGLLDMKYHSIQTSFTGNLESFEYKATESTTIIPVLEGSMISPSFNHIFSGGYAAGYYSYKWAEVLDADAFSVFKENGIFNKNIAKSFRDNILSKGGTEDPMTLYEKFRGHEPTIDALLKRNGILQ